jgi:predicted CXXCH cytochrome family protein
MHANLPGLPLLRWAMACAVAASLALQLASARADTLDDCQRCHSQCETHRKASRAQTACVDVETGDLDRSEHHGMVCLDCHSKSFAEDRGVASDDDPHPKARRAACPDCHVANEPGNGVAFADILQGFEKSAHALKNDAFRCTHCHEPHTFELGTVRNQRFDANKVCLRCHRSETAFQQLVKKSPPDLDKAHSWLPNRDLHWGVVRCLDCHTAGDAPLGSQHLILPKAQAVKRCEACHSAQPVRLLRLYSRMRETEVQRRGFITAAFVNDAYVVGATRNGILDLFAVLIMGATAGGIAGHGALRLLFGFLRKRRHPHEESHG